MSISHKQLKRIMFAPLTADNIVHDELAESLALLYEYKYRNRPKRYGKEIHLCCIELAEIVAKATLIEHLAKDDSMYCSRISEINEAIGLIQEQLYEI